MTSNMETYTTICKIDSQWEFEVWVFEETQTGALCQPGGWDVREVGGSFRREGICVYLWLIHAEV